MGVACADVVLAPFVLLAPNHIVAATVFARRISGGAPLPLSIQPMPPVIALPVLWTGRRWRHGAGRQGKRAHAAKEGDATPFVMGTFTPLGARQTFSSLASKPLKALMPKMRRCSHPLLAIAFEAVKGFKSDDSEELGQGKLHKVRCGMACNRDQHDEHKELCGLMSSVF